MPEFKCLMPTAVPPRPACKEQCETCKKLDTRGFHATGVRTDR